MAAAACGGKRRQHEKENLASPQQLWQEEDKRRESQEAKAGLTRRGGRNDDLGAWRVAGPCTDEGCTGREHVQEKRSCLEDMQIRMTRHVPIFYSNLQNQWLVTCRNLLDSASPLEQYRGKIPGHIFSCRLHIISYWLGNLLANVPEEAGLLLGILSWLRVTGRCSPKSSVWPICPLLSPGGVRGEPEEQRWLLPGCGGGESARYTPTWRQICIYTSYFVKVGGSWKLNTHH